MLRFPILRIPIVIIIEQRVYHDHVGNLVVISHYTVIYCIKHTDIF